MGEFKPIEIPVKLSLAEARAEIERFREAVKEAGGNPEVLKGIRENFDKISDSIRAAKDEAKEFGSEQGIEKVSGSISDIRTNLSNLDFNQSTKGAEKLSKTISQIKPEEVNKKAMQLGETFKALGKVAGQSILLIVKNIGTLAKAFISFGASLLVNPIFLIAVAIIGIITVIGLLLKKLGLLKPILDAVGKVFGAVGEAIDYVIGKIKEFLDWIGLTDFAAEESAEKHADALEKKADAYDKSSETVLFYLDEEIKLLGISGEKTTELELKKQRLIKETARTRAKAIEARIAEAKITGSLDAEEIAALREKLDVQKKIVRQSDSEMKVIKAQAVKEEVKDQQNATKEANAAAKQRAADAKEYAKNRMQAERELKDLELNQMSEGFAKELALSDEKYKRLNEDLVANGKFTLQEKEKFTTLYLAQQEIERGKLVEERRKTDQLQLDELANSLELSKAFRLETMKRDAKAESDLKILLMEEGLQKDLEVLARKKATELENTKLLESEKQVIEEEYRQAKEKIEEQYRKKKTEEERAAQDAQLQIGKVGLESIAGLSNLAFEIKKGKLEEGSAAEERAARKNFELNKKLQIGIAGIQVIQGVIGALTATSVIPEPFGTILKAINAVAVGITGAVNIAKIKNSKFGSTSSPSRGGGSTSAPSASSLSTGGGSSPVPNLFGNPNQFNNQSGAKSVEAGKQEFTVKAVVAADEMTAQQMTEKTIIDASKL